MKWISCKKRLPEPEQSVIAIMESNSKTAIYATYHGDCFSYFYEGEFQMDKYITHWCKLPKFEEVKNE